MLNTILGWDAKQWESAYAFFNFANPPTLCRTTAFYRVRNNPRDFDGLAALAQVKRFWLERIPKSPKTM